MLYVAELTWNGSRGMERKTQMALNRMGERPWGSAEPLRWASSQRGAGSHQQGPCSTTARPVLRFASWLDQGEVGGRRRFWREGPQP